MCGVCKSIYYCGANHQKEHWKKHKLSCKPLTDYQLMVKARDPKVIELEKKALQSGKLQIKYLNPRSDRTLEFNGADTSPAQKLTNEIKEFAHLATRIKNPTIVYVYANPDYQFQHGKCAANVFKVVKKEGGKMIFGYYIYQGKQILEAEAHCVWMLPKKQGVFLDVTKSSCGSPQSGLFVVDFKSFNKLNGGFQPNIVLWR
jgi:hypothetical protein